ncbi:F-box associated domain-containing protein [Carex littledalei]|uniref:F-box associated domain-containing protein n=1 Tax=Carex littledalei TaxID=544730 RepID=A0A833VVJ0_9POAL|nr:F-box associated domain-containing protein [Carex littledalei]
MTFQTRDEAEKILYTYNGVKVMPGTKDRLFCLNWAFERSKGAKPKYEYSKIRTWAFERSKGAKSKYKYSKIRTINYSSNDQSQSPARFQLANNNMQSKIILSFDVRTEATHTLPVPEDIGFGTLIELEGCLCVIEIDEEFRKVNLYILEDYANCKWIKKHTINNFLAWFRPVATRDGKLLFSTYYYDMQNGTFEKTGSQRLYYGFKHGCAESLISPISYLQRSKNPCSIPHGSS